MESLRKAFCLICHGLNSTPQSMHALRDFLNDMGIETKEVVLKGHSGDLSLMKDISALEWEKELLLAYQDVRQKADAAKIPFYYLTLCESFYPTIPSNLRAGRPICMFIKMPIV